MLNSFEFNAEQPVTQCSFPATLARYALFSMLSLSLAACGGIGSDDGMEKRNLKKTSLKSVSVLFALFSLFFMFPAKSLANELRVGFGQDKPPFVIGRTKTGLEIDIFREALAYKGHSLEVHHMPNKRLQIALLNNQDIDAVATVRQIPGDGLYYVDEFIYFDNYAISKAEDNLEINEVSDLMGMSVVAWQNAYRDLGPEFERIFRPNPPEEYKNLYTEHASQEGQNLMFWRNRAEVIVIDRTIFGWYRQQLNEVADTTPEVTFHSIFSGKTYFQAAFKDEELARDFEEGLEYLKVTGRYAQLYNEYLQ